MPYSNRLNRRQFISTTSALAAFNILPGKSKSEKHDEFAAEPGTEVIRTSSSALDLSPAQWIWYPASRVLPNSFFHFRKELNIKGKVKSARGWIVGESRYVLFCDANRIQFGPAPSDPRYTEADPVDLTSHLTEGIHVIGATALYFGFGDGTWPAGKAGFIFNLAIEYENGTYENVISDETWQVQLAKSWQPGKYKRWYLRALQEVFDNRQYPEGWNAPGFRMDNLWKNARITGKEGSKTALNTSIPDYLYDSGSPSVSELRRRTIPLIREVRVSADALYEAHRVQWKTEPEEYFDMVTENAFEGREDVALKPLPDGNGWTFDLPDNDQGVVVSFRMGEQVVGWPGFEVTAPEGCVIELMVEQGHKRYRDGGPALMNQNLNSWTRFICKAGKNNFLTFDYESVMFLQLHFHGAKGRVQLNKPYVLRRLFPFAQTPDIKTSDDALNKLLSASINTVYNNSQDTIVDCMGRERQQYSGDIGHVIHALHRSFGEQRLPSRFVSTFSQGLTLDGYFMDSWPAYDRLNRLAQRQLGLTPWGPLLDHSVGFNYDVWYHYLYSGHQADIEEVYPRLVKFYHYLKSLLGTRDLFPVENLGVPAIWMDTDSYKMQRHKQCAFNLYIAGMLQDAFAKLSHAVGNVSLEQEALELSARLVQSVRRNFWSTGDGMLYNNLPWQKEEATLRTCERSLAHFILGNFAKPEELPSLVQELRTTPQRFGICYPPNAHWRYWALAACGDIKTALTDFRGKWLALASVQENNTLPETWNPTPDSHAQYSHAAIAPLYIAYMCMAGVKVLEPGASRLSIRPMAGDVNEFSATTFTAKGPVRVSWKGKNGRRYLQLYVPEGVSAELVVDAREKLDLPKSGSQHYGAIAYDLTGKTEFSAMLKYL